MPTRAVIFDLGGVLIDVFPERSLAYWRNAAGSAGRLDSLAREIGDSPIHHAFERGEIDAGRFYAELARYSGLSLAASDWEDGWNAMLGPVRAGMAELVAGLAGHVPLYVFSNTNAVHHDVWQARCAHLLGHFREVFVSHRMGQRKPDAAAFKAVAAATGLPTEELLFLDDLEANVGGARAAGLRAACVHRGEDVVQALASHGLMVDNLQAAAETFSAPARSPC